MIKINNFLYRQVHTYSCPSYSSGYWNSHQMKASGLTQLQKPLEQLKQNTPGWENVSTADEFNLLKKILTVMSCFRETSESLSVGKKICIHKIHFYVSFLRQKIEQAKIGEDPDGPMVQCSQ